MFIVLFVFLFVQYAEPESTTNSNSNDNNSQNLHAMEEFIDVIGPTTTENANRSDDSHTPKDLTFNIHHNFMTHIITVRDTITIGTFRIPDHTLEAFWNRTWQPE